MASKKTATKTPTKSANKAPKKVASKKAGKKTAAAKKTASKSAAKNLNQTAKTTKTKPTFTAVLASLEIPATTYTSSAEDTAAKHPALTAIYLEEDAAETKTAEVVVAVAGLVILAAGIASAFLLFT